jgi:hypothetical protein
VEARPNYALPNYIARTRQHERVIRQRKSPIGGPAGRASARHPAEIASIRAGRELTVGANDLSGINSTAPDPEGGQFNGERAVHCVYKIAVKVIDIFGNDTTKVVEVKI